MAVFIPRLAASLDNAAGIPAESKLNWLLSCRHDVIVSSVRTIDLEFEIYKSTNGIHHEGRPEFKMLRAPEKSLV